MSKNNKKYVIYEENNWIKWGVRELNENSEKEDISNKFTDIDEEELSEMGLKPTAKNIPLTDDNDNRIGFNFLSDPNNKDSPRVAVIFSCDFESFQNDNPELIKQLHEKYGNIRWVNKECPGNARPRTNLDQNNMYNKVDGFEDKDDDVKIHDIKKNSEPKSKDTSENIKRGGLLNVFRNFFGSHDSNYVEKYGNSEESIEINKILKERSIPPIIMDNEKFTNLKTENKLSNDHIDIKTHSYYLMEDPKEFLRFTLNNSKGKDFDDDKVKLTYLARQYNTGGGSNWSDTKKGNVINKGETPVYKLRTQGYEEQDYNVLLKTEFEINGDREGDEFRWSLKLEVIIGRKVPSDPSIPRGNLKEIPEFNVVLTKVVNIPPDKKFEGKNSIINDMSIMEGLNELLHEFKQSVESINPKTMMNYSKVMRSNLEKN